MTIKEQAQHILSQLTLAEKIALQVGKDNWRTMPIDRVGLESIMMCDGPHGLRKQPNTGDNLGMGYSLPAVCFPTASKLACSWDRDVLSQLGNALADQCLSEDVSVLLGPGINIKRNTLCGRNFEYFSEDPCLTAELATSYINAVQSKGVGTSLKHFAGNSQEYARMVNDSCIDERALQEIYLSAFGKVIKNSSPYTVMSAYNLLNGTYCTENATLLNKTLRQEWGYDGLVVSDWEATNDRPMGIANGTDLQMPSDDYDSVTMAIEQGTLTEQQLDIAVIRIIELVLKSRNRQHVDIDNIAQHQLARQLSRQCTVLAKNTCAILPLDKTDNIAIIGQLARHPHYQGGGSSKVNATQVCSIVDAFDDNHYPYTYADGYPLDSTIADDNLIEEAVRVASTADKVLLVVGLPDICEYEGFDRQSIAMPESITKLIDAITSCNANCVAVVCSGSPVDMSWDNGTRAVVLDYMSGQAGGMALLDLLYGNVNFAGRLAETWITPQAIQSSQSNFGNDQNKTLYTESIFVGYRYYDYLPQYVHYPFGYGLSYTDFAWKNAKLSSSTLSAKDTLTVTVDVSNIGQYNGSEVVQVHIASLDNKYPTPQKQLKGFAKLHINAQDTKTANITINYDDFAYYNPNLCKWVVDGGRYNIILAKNSQDIIFTMPLVIQGDNTSIDISDTAPSYYNITEDWSVSAQEFSNIYGTIPDYKRTKRQLHTVNSTFSDIKDRLMGRILLRTATRISTKMNTNEEMSLMVTNSLYCSPLRAMPMQSNFTRTVIDGIVEIVNGHIIRGGHKALKAMRKNKKLAKIARKQAILAQKQAKGE